MKTDGELLYNRAGAVPTNAPHSVTESRCLIKENIL